MPDEAASATATAVTPAPSSAPAASTPAPSAAPAAAATTAPAAPIAPAAAPKADAPVSPAGLTKQDVRTGLMDAAKAALTKTRSGEPSPKTDPGSGKGSAATARAPNAAEAAASPDAKSEQSKGPAASADTKGKSEEATGDVDPNAVEDDETKPPPFNEHPRWKKLTRDFENATAEVKQLQPRAEQYDKIVSYMDTYQLKAQDVAIALDITAKSKHNPILAYQTLKPIWDEICKRAGVTLPPDLAQRVKDGFIDEAGAREIAMHRSATHSASHEAQRATEMSDRRASQQANQLIQSAVARWETQQTSKNPDFARLRPFVLHAARSTMAKQGMARTPDEAIAVLEKALKDVNENLQPFRTATPGLNGSTPKQPAAGAPSTAVAAPEPKSLREAMQLGLEGRYRGVG